MQVSEVGQLTLVLQRGQSRLICVRLHRNVFQLPAAAAHDETPVSGE